MSDAHGDEAIATDIEDNDVLGYLEQHPDFFQHHPQLLEKLELRHSTRGGAISLIERQVDLLRERNRRQESHLEQLVETARRNEERVLHMNRLAARLIGASTLEETLRGVHQSICAEFEVEHVLVLLRMAEPSFDVAGLRVIEAGNELDQALADFFRMGKTECGPLEESLSAALWPAVTPLPTSAAMVPLDRARKLGALVLASGDPNRFTPDMGNWFLEQVADLIAGACSAQLAVAADDDA